MKITRLKQQQTPFAVFILTVFLLMPFGPINPVYGVQLKDLATVNRLKNTGLIGYGLLIDPNSAAENANESLFTDKALVKMIERFDTSREHYDDGLRRANHITGVLVTAELSPFNMPGTKINADVSAIGDISGITEGSLLETNLKGLDGKIYAVAQGPVSIAEDSFRGRKSAGGTNNHLVGHLVNGATVKQAVAYAPPPDGNLYLRLKKADRTIMSRIHKAINDRFGKNTAFAVDNANLKIVIPKKFTRDAIKFVHDLGTINIQPAETTTIVIDKQTGTVVQGRNVKISAVAVSHGNLNLIIAAPEINRPVYPAKPPMTAVETQENYKNPGDTGTGVSIEDIARALIAIGATPSEIITIFQAIKADGAINGELKIL